LKNILTHVDAKRAIVIPEYSEIDVDIIKVTVHRFRVQRSGLRTKKALKTRSPR
jgi:hypothetical protein